ncbi:MULTISPECIES: type IV toxin-antitoxin system AbiEi family antitoxin domain-containing protein [Mumia]|nr:MULTISPECIES: type IV toxin-antitoxin system AbiEi family antitoxin domain-containing protein [Mumia]
MQGLERLARRTGGYVTTQAAEDLGYGTNELGDLVERALLVRVRRGAYAIARSYAALPPREAHLVTARHALAARGPGHAVTHDSAVLLHGLTKDALDLPDGRLDLDAVHLARTGGTTSRRSNRIHVHRDALLPTDVTTVDLLPTVRAELAVTQVMSSRPLAVGAVVASSWLAGQRHEARVRGMVEEFDEQASKAELAEALGRLGRRAGVRTARDALEVADAGCENAAEVLVLLTCWSYDLPRPLTQYPLDLPDRRAEVDFLWPDVRMVLEFDGKGKYEDEVAQDGRVIRSGKQKLWAEKVREDAIRGLGYHVVRIGWDDVLPHNRERTAARIRRELAYAARLARRR